MNATSPINLEDLRLCSIRSRLKVYDFEAHPYDAHQTEKGWDGPPSVNGWHVHQSVNGWHVHQSAVACGLESWRPATNLVWSLGDTIDAFKPPENLKACLNETTLVVIKDEVHIAERAGGMDLSWEIAESFLRLGYAPPSELELRERGGRPKTENDLDIMSGLLLSKRTHEEWLRAQGERIVAAIEETQVLLLDGERALDNPA